MESREVDAWLLPQVDLQAEVLLLLDQIPRGSVTTYGDLAQALGDERARSARWLGEFLQNHPHHATCPCHRVVRATGEIGLHVSGDPLVKRSLLEQEGIPVTAAGIVDLSRRFHGLHSSRPLERLREFQRKLGGAVSETPLTIVPRTVAGVDVAYRRDGLACGAYVLLDLASGNVLEEFTLTLPVTFPYIPGYLTYRELPAMLELCRRAQAEGKLADVIFCDGNGRLHPWRAGIATCLGVLLDHPVIGIGKSLLCGRVDLKEMTAGELREVIDHEERIGYAVKANDRARAVYVSVGHRAELGEAALLAKQLMTQHRVPEPIYFADRLSKRLRNQSSAPAARGGSPGDA